MDVTVDYLDSYYKSINLVRMYNVDEIIKGKMPLGDIHRTENIQCLQIPEPWPHPPEGWVALSVDGCTLNRMDVHRLGWFYGMRMEL